MRWREPEWKNKYAFIPVIIDGEWVWLEWFQVKTDDSTGAETFRNMQ